MPFQLSLTVQVSVVLLALLISVSSSAAACLEGQWVHGSWASRGCILPKPADALMQCLARKNILMLGDSTMRQFAYLLAESWGSQLRHLPCNLLMGHGCFDCERGCHHKDYYNTIGRRPDWSDSTGFTPAGKTLWYSWKPEMFSLDDIRLLEGFVSKGNHFDIVMVHKGVHAVADWDEYGANGMPQAAFLEENRVRATLLADLLAKHFPQARLIWRDGYSTRQTPEKDALTDSIRDITTPIFLAHGFTILPGHNVTMAAPAELQNDTLHPDESIVELLLTMVASITCPSEANVATQHLRSRVGTKSRVHGRDLE